jgi:ribosome biogenesis GTPase
MTDLESLGWNSFFASHFAPYEKDGLIPARITIEQKTHFFAATGKEELRASLAGKLRFEARGEEDVPGVGDWVALRPTPGERTATIVRVLPRKSKFSRKMVGRERAEQTVAANIDLVFLVNALDATFNLRRLERYLVLAAGSGAQPAVVLNKSDLCDDLSRLVNEVRAVASQIPVYVMSAARGEGLEPLRNSLGVGVTGAFLGPSGVGKSTIINRLIGLEKLKTRKVREYDGKGRHTTSHREMVVLPSGGILIDTPGMRELQLWEGEEGIEEAFDDIESLAATCRFRNCRHDSEPECAVRKALQEGILDQGRCASYLKLQREIERQSRTYDTRAQALEKERVKKLTSRQQRDTRKR